MRGFFRSSSDLWESHDLPGYQHPQLSSARPHGFQITAISQFSPSETPRGCLLSQLCPLPCYIPAFMVSFLSLQADFCPAGPCFLPALQPCIPRGRICCCWCHFTSRLCQDIKLEAQTGTKKQRGCCEPTDGQCLCCSGWADFGANNNCKHLPAPCLIPIISSARSPARGFFLCEPSLFWSLGHPCPLGEVTPSPGGDSSRDFTPCTPFPWRRGRAGAVREVPAS